MSLSKEQRERMTRKALEMQQKNGQRRSVLAPYRDWIREMIEDQGITFKVLTQVLATECGIRITEQSLNEWYHRHIGKPPRSRRPAREKAPQQKSAGKTSTRTAKNGQGEPSKRRPKPNLDFNQPDDWKII